MQWLAPTAVRTRTHGLTHIQWDDTPTQIRCDTFERCIRSSQKLFNIDGNLCTETFRHAKSIFEFIKLFREAATQILNILLDTKHGIKMVWQNDVCYKCLLAIPFQLTNFTTKLKFPSRKPFSYTEISPQGPLPNSKRDVDSLKPTRRRAELFPSGSFRFILDSTFWFSVDPTVSDVSRKSLGLLTGNQHFHQSHGGTLRRNLSTDIKWQNRDILVPTPSINAKF